MAALIPFALVGGGLYKYYNSSKTESVAPTTRLMSLKNGFVPTTVVEPWHEHQYTDLTFEAATDNPDEAVHCYQKYQLAKTEHELSCPELKPLHALL